MKRGKEMAEVFIFRPCLAVDCIHRILILTFANCRFLLTFPLLCKIFFPQIYLLLLSLLIPFTKLNSWLFVMQLMGEDAPLFQRTPKTHLNLHCEVFFMLRWQSTRNITMVKLLHRHIKFRCFLNSLLKERRTKKGSSKGKFFIRWENNKKSICIASFAWIRNQISQSLQIYKRKQSSDCLQTTIVNEDSHSRLRLLLLKVLHSK